ncbi:LysR family transcriptional regulator [Pseudoalteromonas sp. MMG012]|uniref:LysR family transcriptional regulator n=1 Tax=Pseudoalteromonas sp. MMG012 TaxID=2822686 RepID=UPI001B39E4C4|nr:LysR family transcriptional regulator [Pseudoalteromonas sp. MMG012]MBQ4852326.1 LysR family transcriptional regulator [Pseudoalteromonas sp. MMG012]
MYPAITIEALKALDAIDKKGSFAAAAQSLYKVPSALTYTIKKLEEDIGTALFDRSKQRAVLTPAGKLVLAHGRDILQATNEMVDAVAQLASGWERQLRIARDTVIPPDILFELLAEFTQLPQSVDVTLSEEALGGGWDALHSKRADIVIGASGELPKGLFNTHKISQVHFVFAVASHHPLASVSEVIDIEHLRQYPSIVVADSSQVLPARDSGWFNSKQVIRVNSMSAKLMAQLQGIGVGFLPRHLADPYLKEGTLVQKKCAIPRPNQDLYIAWNKGQEGNALTWFIPRLCQSDWAC